MTEPALRRLLIVDNMDSDSIARTRMHQLKRSLHQAARELGVQLRLDVVARDQWRHQSAEHYQGVILTGGQANPTRSALRSGWLAHVAAQTRGHLAHSDVPLLGICMGHQLLGTHQGSADLSARAIRELETVREMHVERTDPLLRGLGSSFRLVLSHGYELSNVPPGFILLARGEFPAAAVQIMRHESKPVYGVQAHPEIRRSRAIGHSGIELLKNFIRMCGSRSS